MPGIEDIANDLKVSTCLVSRVLSGKLGTTRVSVKTANNIRRRAEELGYRKNHAAAALSQGRHGAIAAFVRPYGVAGSGLVSAAVEGIAQQANANHQRMVLCFYRTPEEFTKQYSEIADNAVDGLIVAGGLDREIGRQLLQLQKSGRGVVTMYHEPISPRIVNVGCSDFDVGRAAVNHLLERGCQNIVHLKVYPRQFDGYRHALEASGLPYRPEMVYEAPNFEMPTGEAAVAHFAANGIEYDGLIAQSDQQAAGAINALTRLGRRVPYDVKVIGVDDSAFCQFLPIQLSSISSRERRRAVIAMQLLLDQINQVSVQSVSLEPEVRARASTETCVKEGV
jgi:LacI family transcriptional regulator